MHREQLNPNTDYAQHRGQLERSEEALIVGEFAQALLNWKPLSAPLVEWSSVARRSRVQEWFIRRYQLLQDFEPAFWFLTRAEAEGTAFLKMTFDELAEERGTSRQNIQQEFERIMVVLNKHEPKLADAVWAYREHKSYSTRPDGVCDDE